MWTQISPVLQVLQGENVMKNSSRHFVQAACAIALVLGCGIGIAAAQPAVVVERGVMPPPRVEVVPVAPGPGYNWVPGHWAWRGSGWVWIGGHHVRGVVAPTPAEVVEVVPARPAPS